MISRVSLTTVATVTSEPSNSSSLVNVMESKSQCEANLKAAHPCSYQPTYIAGNSDKIHYDPTVFVNLALFGNCALFLDQSGDLNSYDYTTGTKSNVGYSGYSSSSSSMAVDAQGITYIIDNTAECGPSQSSCIIALNTSDDGEAGIGHVFTNFSNQLNGIINDNAYNLYVFDNQTVYSLSSTGSIAPIFNIQDFTDADVEPRPNFYPPVPYTINTTSIYSVAVYYEQETQSTMVYYASSGGTYSELYKYSFHAKSKPITLLMEYGYSCAYRGWFSRYIVFCNTFNVVYVQ